MFPSGVSIGNATDKEAATGCTVILCKEGATVGVDVRGGGPATRETDLLRPENMVQSVHAVVLSGGSAYGLDAASGVMRYLEEADCGFDVGVGRVPIVCAASLFDLQIGNAKVRPNAEMGYAACCDAESFDPRTVAQGVVGAGTGATVGKLLGPQLSTKSGLGYACIEQGDLYVGALVAVNAVGNVLNTDGTTLAGVRNPQPSENAPYLQPTEALALMMQAVQQGQGGFAGNTTIGCVITNACLSKAQATKVSSVVHDAYARTIKPVHTLNDGDTIFTMATNEVEAAPQATLATDLVGILATDVMETAIRNAVQQAESLCGVPALRA